ncbi:hypothetical protein FRB99_000484 [Tulasnella sp. 403]|nr:hypothetical protein FRB99_000484 [Tulasnella sp. 403]
MSLSNASAEISSHPGKNTVTVPTDKATQAADVDRKLRLYGVIEALRAGKFPDNAQIDGTLTYVGQHSPIDISKLSHDGQKLVSDSRDIIETARLIVKEKNADELIQNFIWHTTSADFSKAKVDTDAANPVPKDDVRKDGRQAIEHLRTLLTLVLTNSEARKLLSDVSLIGRDLFARGAMKVAEKSRPNPEQLANVNEAAPPETWESTNANANAGQTPAASANVGGTSVVHDPKTGNTTVRNPDGTTQTAGAAIGDARQAALGHAEQTRATVAADENPDGTKRTLKDRLVAGYNSVTDRIPDEHKDKASAHIDRARDFLKEEFPEERRDQFIYRLKKVIVECQKHQDYTMALTWFLDTTEAYFAHGKTMHTNATGQASNVVDDPELRRAGSELRTVLERFANGKSLGGIEDAARALYNDAQTDEDLRNWFRQLDEFVRKTLLEPGYVLSPQCSNRANELIDTGGAFFDDKYKVHKDNLFDQVSAWFSAWADDPLNQRFSSDWKRLTKDLLFDSDGNLAFKPQLWHDIRRVIMPSLIENVGYVPIPRIEYTDNTLDLVIENLTLQGQNLFPNVISLEAHNFVKFSPYDKIPDEHHHDFKFVFSQVQADMRDVAFYFNKKNGFPKIRDSGLADVFLGGEGLTVKVHLASAGRDRSSVFYVKDVDVKLDSLKFSVRDSKHDLLYKTLKPLATGLVKKQISKAITDAIRTGFEYVDEQLVQVRDRMAEAKASDDSSRKEVLKNMFERKQDEAASKKSQSTSHFKVVAKRDSVLLPNTGHEAGWINKQAEREAAAQEGENWHSKAVQDAVDKTPSYLAEQKQSYLEKAERGDFSKLGSSQSMLSRRPTYPVLAKDEARLQKEYLKKLKSKFIETAAKVQFLKFLRMDETLWGSEENAKMEAQNAIEKAQLREYKLQMEEEFERMVELAKQLEAERALLVAEAKEGSRLAKEVSEMKLEMMRLGRDRPVEERLTISNAEEILDAQIIQLQDLDTRLRTVQQAARDAKSRKIQLDKEIEALRPAVAQAKTALLAGDVVGEGVEELSKMCSWYTSAEELYSDLFGVKSIETPSENELRLTYTYPTEYTVSLIFDPVTTRLAGAKLVGLGDISVEEFVDLAVEANNERQLLWYIRTKAVQVIKGGRLSPK